MWAVYKALDVYGFTAMNDNGTPGDTSDDFLVGNGMSNAAGGITIGQDWGPQTSAAGDWFSDHLIRTSSSSDLGAPPPTVVIPEPVTMAGLALGLGGLITYVRRRRR